MWSVIRNAFRRTALAAFAGGVLLAGLGAITPESAQAATLYISEFATGVTNAPGSDQAQIPPQSAIVDQTVALSGTTALSTAFNTKTHAVMLMCDEGCSISFGTSSATATTSNFLLQQGVPYTFGVAPGQFVAAIANAAGNTGGGSGGPSSNVNLAQVAGTATVTAGVNGLLAVGGNIASGAADSGNPVKIGCVFNTTPPAPSNGNRVDCQGDSNGDLITSQRSNSTVMADTLSNTIALAGGSTSAGAFGGASTRTLPFLFNGGSWDRQRSDTNILGAALVVPNPTSTAAAGITPVVSAALESNHVIKNSAGNLYAFSVTTGAQAGWVLISNSTTAPTAGGAAIAPLGCYLAAANSTLGVTLNPPLAASTGITIVFSSSGCLTNTASATTFIAGYAK